MCSWSLLFNPNAINTIFLSFFFLFFFFFFLSFFIYFFIIIFFSCRNSMVFLITAYLFTRHRSPYTPVVNKMPNFCTMAKECDIFSFELHSYMLNFRWIGEMVFNQRFVISLRTGVLHACLSPKRHNLTTLASWEKDLCSVWASRTAIPVWLYGRLNKRLNYMARFRMSASVPKFQHYFNWHPPSMLLKLTLRNHLRKIALRFSFHNTVLPVWRWAAVVSTHPIP